MDITLLHVGGPTLVLDLAGLRVVTDPTFDPPGQHPIGDGRVLVKLAGPAVSTASLGAVDLVLLSHDQHPDNLDTAGRELLEQAHRWQDATFAELTADWTAAEVELFTVLMRRLISGRDGDRRR